ncbi:unnamed protein product [Lepeophtheirus salmonis]|uniref:(salmon louse) hypothetical protein n=1 Tax=Lepeophtheirus salmonis TaxID=72036 RepID=A0A7R8HBV1_LEPSM|nr:unnamed protein product [Lepeophtheirus salmonis]CAF2978314.1 unnamed protein product [Lepeophtheirus salmonis]
MVYFPDNSSNLVQTCISCKSFIGYHSDANISELLNNKGMEFGLFNKVVIFTTDHAPNMSSGVRESVELSSEKKFTASKIVPLSRLLLIRYRTLSVDNRFSEGSSVGKLVRDMLINMEKRFLTTESNVTLCRATMLDLRFRGFENM